MTTPINKILKLGLLAFVVISFFVFTGSVFAGSFSVGTFDAVDNSSCQVAGWAKDPDTTVPIQVHIYKDDPFPQGQIVATIVADLLRSDLPYTDKNHGFAYQLPSASGLYDDQDHAIYIYGIDATGDANVLLNLSPKTIRCSSAVATVNVKDFGAKGDGITDDAPIIQRALDSLPATGGTIYIPPGTYMLGTSAGGVEFYPDGKPILSALIVKKSNVRVAGDGTSSILKLMPSKKMRVISADQVSNITLEKVLIDGNKSQRNGTHPWPSGDVVDGLVYGNRTANFVVQNCEIRNGIEDGGGFWLGNNNTFQNCFVHDNGTTAAGAVGISLSGGSDNKALSNNVTNNSSAGIAVGYGSTNATVKNNVIKNNLGEGLVVGGNGTNSSFTVTGNTIEGNGASGFSALSIFSSQNGTLSQNTVANNIFYGIHFSDDGKSGSSNWTVENNTCSNTTSARSQGRGIMVEGLSSGITLRGNKCENNGISINDQIVVTNPNAVNSDWKSVNTISYTQPTPTPSTTLSPSPTPIPSPTTSPTPTPIPTPTSSPTPAPVITPTPLSPFTGYYYSSSNRRKFNKLLMTRQDPAINFDWGLGSPNSTVPSDNFAVYWVGNINFQNSGTYNFTAITDDGMKVWIDGKPVLEKWFDQYITTYNFSQYLTAGSHQIEVAYYEKHNTAKAVLNWSQASVLGESTLNILSMLGRGRANPKDRVFALQNVLYQLGLLTISPTGFFGPLTEKAVKNLQAQYGLPQTGIVGEQTREIFNSTLKDQDLE